MRDQRVRWAITVVGCAAIYVGAAQIGFALTLVNGAVSTVWVPAGLSLAILFLGGRNLWPALVLGEFVANTLHGSGAGTSLAFGVGDALEALAGRAVLVRLGFRPQLDRLRDIFILLIPGALIPSLVGASVGTFSLLIGEHAPWSSVWLTWHTWWLGDATGIIIATPLIFAFASEGFRPIGRHALELVAFVAALVPLAWVAGGHAPEAALVALPVLAWGALRFGQRGATVANAIVAGAGVALVAHGSELSGVPLVNRLLLAQEFLLVAAITTLVLAAVLSERERVEAQLRINERGARALVAEQTVLSDFATAVARETPLADLFALLVREICDLAEARAVTIQRDDGIGRLTQVAKWQSGDEGGDRDTSAEIELHGVRWGQINIVGGVPHPAGLTLKPDAAETSDEASMQRFARVLGIALANAEAREALINRAATDPLTGLANHRTFHERLADEMIRSRRYGHVIAVAMIDIDNFKAVNDTWGHRAGDSLLSAAARRIASVMRADALVARLGGDEFAVLLPESDCELARVAAERAREAVAELMLEDGLPISISVGVCDSTQAGTPDQLVERADLALYAAKSAGRNRCVAYTL
ncbi:MAG TPA: diguanylate cyclase [Solirubrobacteraceae bacterium]|nr:diguanylate cyclase [Solirubrobacteraceae bacterium]